jgi:outer membrane protein
MTIPSRRMVLTFGLGVVGLVGRAFGQAPDEVKEKAKGPEKEKAAKPDDPGSAPPPSTPPTGLIGVVDMSAVMKGFLKARDSGDRFLHDLQARRAELKKMAERAKRDADDLATLQPGTRDHADLEARVKEEKAKFEASRKQADAEYNTRQTELLATFQHEIQEAIAVVARRRGLTLVLRTPKGPEERANLGAVVSTILREVLYVDTRADLTEDVIALLNSR